MADANSIATRSTCMTEEEQNERRKRIREIMADPNLSSQEKNKNIQGLMDGRRRSSATGSVTWSVTSSLQDGDELFWQQGPPQHQHQHQQQSQFQQQIQSASGHFSFSSLVVRTDQQTGMGSDEDEEDMMMDEAPDDIYDHHDYRSVASSVSDYSDHSNDNGHTGAAFLLPPGTYRQMHGRSLSLQDWNEEDRRAAIASVTPALFADHPDQIGRFMEHSRPHCPHYDRQCTIISPCCGLPFGCRICHDDCPVLPPPKRRQGPSYQPVAAAAASSGGPPSADGGGKMERRRSMPLNFDESDFDDEPQHHLIDRFAIREVICRKCFVKQSSKTNNCKSCGVKFGEYHCNICNLWMPAKESPYHCADCGFCRVGGRENFRHCHDCGMCIDTKLFDDHNCKAGKYYSNCPVCQEDLFSSRQASHEMPCGHAIHWHCFKELTSFDTRCPVCKKTAETPEQMEPTWSAIAMGIALQPVPAELARVVNVICNDCEERDYERRWHFLGVRCMHCRSFNTQVEQILLQGLEAAEFLDRQDSDAPMMGAVAGMGGAGGGGGDDGMMQE